MVAAFAVLLALPWLGEAWHVDEPFFLAIARQIQSHPLSPYAFRFDWYGRSVPMDSINNSPPLLPYLLAAAMSIAGGSEFWTRLLFLPFDVCAALGIYFLAARFLKKPLLPALICAAGPAQVINLGHLMTEKLVAAFSFAALALIVASVDERDESRWAAGWFLFALALLSKYAAVFLMVPAAAYAIAGGVPPRKVVVALLGAGSGLALWLAARAWGGGAPVGAAWSVLKAAGESGTGSFVHRARAWSAFVGGLTPAALVLFCAARPRARVGACALAVAVVFFLPVLDAGAATSSSERLLGIAMAAAGLCVLWAAWTGDRPEKSRIFWRSWIAGALVFQVFVNWSVMARLVLFVVPPIVFALCESAEFRAEGLSPRFAAAALGVTLLLTLPLAAADRVFADASKSFVADASRLKDRGYLLCAGHWGLEYYAAAAGIRQMQKNPQAWTGMKPGEAVFAGRMDAPSLRPPQGLKVRTAEFAVPYPVPLRLVGAWSEEAAFYSSAMGFLPWSVSRQPIETFTVIERLPDRPR